jgi:hypothetical protein
MKRLAVKIFAFLLTCVVGISATLLKHAPRPTRSVVGISATKLEQGPPPTVGESPWNVLLSFENQDLERQCDSSRLRLQNAIDALTGKPNPHIIVLTPRLFRKILNSKGETRYILVEEAPLVLIPGKSGLRIHIFDMAGTLLSATDFGTGWRTRLTRMNIAQIPKLNQQGFVVNGEYCFGGHPSRQYYVVVGDRIMLAHAETDGQLEINDYIDSDMTIGPRSFGRSADDWEKALHSPEPAEVLNALTWLGGRHASSKPKSYNYDEEITEVQAIEAVRSRATVRNTLIELSKSENSWMRAAAKMALKETANV